MRQPLIAILLIVFGCMISQADVGSDGHQLCSDLWWQNAVPDDLIPFSYDEIFFHQICDDYLMNTPLHVASQYTHRDVARKLFKMDIVNIFVEDIYGRTPMSLANEELAWARHDFLTTPLDQGDAQSRYLRRRRAREIVAILRKRVRLIKSGGQITIHTDFRLPMPYNAN